MIIALWLALFLPVTAPAGMRLAFLEVRDYHGRLIQLEQGGRFAHIALSCRDQWLHAYPFRGVEFILEEDLRRLGSRLEIVELESPEPTPEQIRFFLGKPYDTLFRWDDRAIYCSELVGKIIGMPPEPMSFSGPAWKGKATARGEPGLSPDKIYRNLKSAAATCERNFGALQLPPRK